MAVPVDQLVGRDDSKHVIVAGLIMIPYLSIAMRGERNRMEPFQWPILV